MRELGKEKPDSKLFIRAGRRHIEGLEKMMLDDLENEGKDKDQGWDAGSVREEFAPIFKTVFKTTSIRK